MVVVLVLASEGVVPPPRSRHCSAVVEKSLYIWGGIGGGIGVHVLDTQTMDWTTPDVVGAVPDSRFGHTCVPVDPASQPRREPVTVGAQRPVGGDNGGSAPAPQRSIPVRPTFDDDELDVPDFLK